MERANSYAYRLLLVFVAVAGIVLLRDVLALGFLGILLGILLGVPVDLLATRMPRGWSLLVVLIVGAAAFGAVGYFASRRVVEQARQIEERVPDALARARTFWDEQTSRHDGSGQQSQTVPKPNEDKPKAASDAHATSARGSQILAHADELAMPLWSRAGQAARGLIELMSGCIVVFVLAAFFAHAPQTYRDGLRALVPREAEPQLAELWTRSSRGLRHWLLGTLVSMSIMGLLTALGLALVGMDDWLLLGLLTFVGTFVPYVGAIASAIPGMILALAESPEKFLAVAGVYLAIHIVEGYIVQPLIMKRAVFIRPAVLLLWQLAMAALLGILGVVIATPLLVCVKVATGYLYIEGRLGKQAAEV